MIKIIELIPNEYDFELKLKSTWINDYSKCDICF